MRKWTLKSTTLKTANLIALFRIAILRTLPEREREDINYEVTRVLKDGLKLRDIEIEKN